MPQLSTFPSGLEEAEEACPGVGCLLWFTPFCKPLVPCLPPEFLQNSSKKPSLKVNDAFLPPFLSPVRAVVQAGGWAGAAGAPCPLPGTANEQQRGLLNAQRSEVKQAAVSHPTFPGSDPRLRLGALKGLKHPGASPRRNGHGHVGSGAAGCRAGAGEAFPALLFLLGAGRDPVV